MASKRGSDYIPMAGELEGKKQAMHEYWATHEDPRHDYVATYTMYGNSYKSEVVAMNAAEAEDIMKQQLSLVGVFPKDLKISMKEQ